MSFTPAHGRAPAGAADLAVLVMARVPRRGEVRQALEPLIGQDGCLALQTALLLQTLAWARALSPRLLGVAHEPADAGRELQRLTGPDVMLLPQNGEGIAARVADAVARMHAHSPGPMLVLWPDLPRLLPYHAQAVYGDLRAGADIVLGPVFDGGFYLIALARPLPRLFALSGQVWRGRDALQNVLDAVARAHLQAGVLRSERALHRPADARAALADPLLPEPIARALRHR
jgi:hypothetical protein